MSDLAVDDRPDAVDGIAADRGLAEDAWWTVSAFGREKPQKALGSPPRRLQIHG